MMENKIATIITNKLVQLSIISKDYHEVYIYGLELILSFISTATIIIFLGIICRQVLLSIIFISIFVLLRRLTGGYHANTHLGCKLCTISIFIINLLLSVSVEFKLIPNIIINGIGLIIIILFSPIENKHKPISPQQCSKIKHLAIFTYILLIGIEFLLYVSDSMLSNGIFYSLNSVIALMLIEKIKGRRIKK
jgi:accessory gene regulator B